MQRIETSLPGVFIFEPRLLGDDRGWFFESYNADLFHSFGIDLVFVQDNHSQSKKGVLRGLHFQRDPKPMAKLVRCTKGRIWDVAVDIRKDSPTYKQWFGLELSAENKKMLLIPAGFAHGFYTLEDAEVLYKCSNTFDAELDGAVAWNEEQFGIEWPLEGNPILSDKDRNAFGLDTL